MNCRTRSPVEPRALVVAESLRPQLSELPVAELPTLGIGGNYEDTLSAASVPILESFDAESGLVILYTSGTTGLPKAHSSVTARWLPAAWRTPRNWISHDIHDLSRGRRCITWRQRIISLRP